MFFVFLVLWIVFNGKVTWEIIGIGLLVSAIMFWFICKFMDYSIEKDYKMMKCTPLLIWYFLILIKEIVKANVVTIKLITTFRYELEPVIVPVKTRLKTKAAKVLLANSITLTPGTITVSLEGDELMVHCLDKDLSEGIEDSVFVKLLERIEGMEGIKGKRGVKE